MKLTRNRLKQIVKEELFKQIIKEELSAVLRNKSSDLKEEKSYWLRLFDDRWGDESTWEMVDHDSLVDVYNNMRWTPQEFIDKLPYEWQKPKAIEALESLGVPDDGETGGGKTGGGSFVHSDAGTDGDPARAKKTRDFRMDPKTGKVSE